MQSKSLYKLSFLSDQVPLHAYKALGFEGELYDTSRLESYLQNASGYLTSIEFENYVDLDTSVNNLILKYRREDDIECQILLDNRVTNVPLLMRYSKFIHSLFESNYPEV
jgi:hypothetical protein